MKYYFAGMESETKNGTLKFLKNVNHFDILMSYFYINKVDIETLRLNGFNLMLDSGAFTAWTQKKEIKIDDYIEFLHKNTWIKNYITLDVIGDPEKTLQNLEIFRGNKLSPIPVFHMGSKIKDLYKLVDLGYNYIALGGMAVKSMQNRKKIIEFCLECFKKTEGMNISFHGLGLGSPSITSLLNFESVDSTTWLSIRRWLRHPMGKSHDIFKEVAVSDKPKIGITEIQKWLMGTNYKKVYQDFLLDPEGTINETLNKKYE